MQGTAACAEWMQQEGSTGIVVACVCVSVLWSRYGPSDSGRIDVCHNCRLEAHAAVDGSLAAVHICVAVGQNGVSAVR